MTGNQELFNNIGDKSFTVDSFRNVYQQDPDLARKMAVGTFMASGGKRSDLVGAKEGAEYSNFYWDDDGNPLAFNKKTEKYQRIKTPATKAKTVPQTVIDFGKKGRTREQASLADIRTDEYKEIKGQARGAENQIDALEQLRAINLKSGFGTGVKTKAAKIVKFLGGDAEELLGVNISDVEKFNSVAQKQVLDIMATQSGPQTDQDATRIEKAVAGIENEEDSNKFIINSMEALANRRIEQNNFWVDYMKDNNGTLEGVDSAWSKFKRDTPMVSDVVRNNKTGQPVFFYQFRDKYLSQKVPMEKIIESWRKVNQR